jgi:hypothetical protein
MDKSCYQETPWPSEDYRDRGSNRNAVANAGIALIDSWIEKYAADLSRPEAIRRLVELGLKAKT